MATETMVVPSDRTLLHWQGKFDLLSMLWSRETLATSTDLVDRHLSADGSPQAGYHFLCAREDVFSTADSIMDSGELSAFAFCTRSMVPSLLGLGCSNVAGTVMRIVHILLLEAGPNIDKYRHQVRSWAVGPVEGATCGKRTREHHTELGAARRHDERCCG